MNKLFINGPHTERKVNHYDQEICACCGATISWNKDVSPAEDTSNHYGIKVYPFEHGTPGIYNVTGVTTIQVNHIKTKNGTLTVSVKTLKGKPNAR